MDIPVLYINLERSKYRNNNMIERLQALNINYYRVNGIDMDNIDKNALKDGECQGIKYHINNNKLFSPRQKEIAIILSHLTAVEYVLTQKYNMAIIMEDDMSFQYIDDWNKTIQNILKTAPDNWSILKLHTSAHRVVEDNCVLYKKGINYIPLKREALQSAGCYIINYNGAKQLINKYKRSNVFNFPQHNECAVCEHLIFSIPNVYVYTLPVFCAVDNNLTCMGNHNPADKSTNRVTHKFWESIGIDINDKRVIHNEKKEKTFGSLKTLKKKN